MSTTPATQGDSNLGGGLLTEARAKEILAEQKFKVTSNGDVHNDIPMVVIHRGPVCVLGGAFELKTLEALVFWVKAQQAKRKATQ